MTDLPHTLAFIGAGHMAEAIARAAIDHGVLPADRLIASDPTPERRVVFADLGVATTDDNAAAVASAEQVLLATKPQAITAAGGALARQFGDALRDGQIVITIMAGITTAKLADALGRPADATPIVRVMPNTPMLVGRGMAGVALGPGARPGDDDLAMRLFSAGNSKAIRVDEPHLDAVTAVSGSGPAYLFYLAEAMTRAAHDLGLADHADTLVAQTLLGSAELLADSEHPPAELRRRVTSPGGTTEAAINHLDGNTSHDVIVNALKAAATRSVELGLVKSND
ncbi:MAG: pyrroline-5-carboxylate reductase [Planctomycetota bacterium]